MEVGCEFCDQAEPTLSCNDCVLNLCDACSSQVHAKGKLTEHKVVSYLCEICQKSRSEVDCRDCDIGFCPPCFTKLHSRGTMTQHLRCVRESVKGESFDSRQLLNSLPGQLPSDVQVGPPTTAVTPVTSPQPAAMSPAGLSLPANSLPTLPSTMFCGGTTRTCAPAPARPEDAGLYRSKNAQALPEVIGSVVMPCQHRINQRMFSYRKTGELWEGRDVVPNVFVDVHGETQVQFQVREDGIYCNICPPQRAPRVRSDLSNLRSHAKSDFHLNHLTLRLTGNWPSSKPTGLCEGWSPQPPSKKTAILPTMASPTQENIMLGSPGFEDSSAGKAPRKMFTDDEQKLLEELGNSCDWSKKNNSVIEEFAQRHGMSLRRVKAWLGNHKPTRKKYRYSYSSSGTRVSHHMPQSRQGSISSQDDIPLKYEASSEDDVLSLPPQIVSGTTTITLLPSMMQDEHVIVSAITTDDDNSAGTMTRLATAPSDGPAEVRLVASRPDATEMPTNQHVIVSAIVTDDDNRAGAVTRHSTAPAHRNAEVRLVASHRDGTEMAADQADSVDDVDGSSVIIVPVEAEAQHTSSSMLVQVASNHSNSPSKLENSTAGKQT